MERAFVPLGMLLALLMPTTSATAGEDIIENT